MPHFIQMKKSLKANILSALDQAGELDLDKTIAQFSLDTGFTEKTVRKVLLQLSQLGYIKIDGFVISRPAEKRKEVMPA